MWRKIPLILCALAWLASPAHARDAATAASPAPSGVRCPDCDRRGHMSCPRCEGEGKLHRQCRRCGGTGRKSCLVCTKETNDAGPGKLECPGCGGAGSSSATGKICSRCRGERSLPCITCLGKGSRSCRTRVPVGSCPRCRSRGRVPCETCDGSLSVSAETLARRAAEKAKEAAARSRASKSSSPGATTRSPSPGGRISRASARELNPEFTLLAQRYKALTLTHERHLEIFTVDPRPDLKPVRREAAAILKRARRHRDASQEEAGPAAFLVQSLEKFFARLNQFNRRWSELREIFQGELKTYRTVRSVWERRDEIVRTTPEARIAHETADLDSRLELALRIGESRSTPLAAESPEWLVEEAESLHKTWPKLKEGAETELKALALEARKAQEEADKAAGSGRSRRASSRRSPGPRTVAKSSGSRKADDTRRSSRRVRATSAATPTGDATSRRKVNDAGGPPTDGSGWTPLWWTLAGFGLASGIFFMVDRMRKRPETQDEDGWEDVD